MVVAQCPLGDLDGGLRRRSGLMQLAQRRLGQRQVVEGGRQVGGVVPDGRDQHVDGLRPQPDRGGELSGDGVHVSDVAQALGEIGMRDIEESPTHVQRLLCPREGRVGLSERVLVDGDAAQ